MKVNRYAIRTTNGAHVLIDNDSGRGKGESDRQRNTAKVQKRHETEATEPKRDRPKEATFLSYVKIHYQTKDLQNQVAVPA